MCVPLLLPGVQEFAEYRNVLLATPIEDDFGSDILDTHEEPLTSLFNRPTTIILETLADENKVGHTVKCVRACVRACMRACVRVCVHACVCVSYVLHMSALSQLPMGGKERQLVVHVECRCTYVGTTHNACIVCSKYVCKCVSIEPSISLPVQYSVFVSHPVPPIVGFCCILINSVVTIRTYILTYSSKYVRTYLTSVKISFDFYIPPPSRSYRCSMKHPALPGSSSLTRVTLMRRRRRSQGDWTPGQTATWA